MPISGMLAFSLPIPLTYDLGLTIASLVIAIAISGFALSVASNPEISLTQLSFAALIMGAGISGMHYTGMAASRGSTPRPERAPQPSPQPRSPRQVKSIPTPLEIAFSCVEILVRDLIEGADPLSRPQSGRVATGSGVPPGRPRLRAGQDPCGVPG